VLDVGTGTGIWAIDFGESGHLFVPPLFDLAFADLFSLPKLMSTPKLRLNRTWSCHSAWGVGTDKMSQVIGVDLSPIQPALYEACHNSWFTVDD
jgi:hypothetical protein